MFHHLYKPLEFHNEMTMIDDQFQGLKKRSGAHTHQCQITVLALAQDQDVFPCPRVHVASRQGII